MSARMPQPILIRAQSWDSSDQRIITVAAAGAALAGLAASLIGPLAAGGLFVAVVFAAAAYRPIFATYAYLATLPFIAGLERGTLVPGVRLNEALFALLLLGVGFGGYVRFLRGDPIPLRLRPLDPPLAFFVLLATVWPVASMMLRGQQPQASDLAAVLTICKLAALLLLVRITVDTEAQLVRCARLIIWPTAGIALIAILQTLSFGPVLGFLEMLWPADAGGLSQRGTTTLGSSIATGDCIITGLTLLLCCSARNLLGRAEQLGLGSALGAGVLAAGQFSTWISALVAGFLLLQRFPGLRRRAVQFLPLVGVAALIGAPAFLGRVGSFAEGFGVPRSWLGRWDNLTSFYLPQLADFHFVLGVSPDSVLPAPETWREVIYLESGYLQLLWVGGVPLLAGFTWLSIAVLRASKQLGTRGDAVGAYAQTLGIVWWMVLILSVIDIHLVVRGFGDLLFVLLAITSGRLGHARDA